MRSRLAAAGLAAAGLVGGGVVVLGSGSGTAAPVPHPTCPVLRATAHGDHGLSTVYRVDLGTGAMTRLRLLDRRVDALGYHRGQRLVYGLSGGRLVSLSLSGELSDRAAVRGHEGLREASAGAVIGDSLVVRDGRHLRSVSINPADPRFGSVVRSVRLWPAELARTVDDFDVNGGLLYGVTTHVPYYGKVVRIDPTTGHVSHVDGPKLPGGRSYGSAAFGPDGALFAASNRTADHDWFQHDKPLRSLLVRVALTPTAVPQEIAAWPVATHSDMTGCLASPPIPPTSPTTTPPPPSPPTTTQPTSPPTTTTTTTPPPAPVAPPPVIPPAAQPPPPAPVPPEPAPPVVVPPRVQPPPPAPMVKQSKRVSGAATPAISPTEKKRRWGITTLVLIMGAGAAAGAAHRNRR